MKELHEIATEKMKSMIEDGTVEKMVHDNLEKTVAKIIEDAMKKYSDFGEVLDKKIKESLQIAGNKIELPAYNQFIQQIINDTFTGILQKNAITHLSEIVSEVIEPIKKEAKISEVMHKVERAWAETAREQGKSEIEIEASENDDDTTLYVVFKHPEYDWEDIKVTFYNHNRKKLIRSFYGRSATSV